MPLPLAALPQQPGVYTGVFAMLNLAVDADFSVTKGVYVATDGALSVIMADGSAATFTGIQAGTILPIRITGTRASGTTVTNIQRLY